MYNYGVWAIYCEAYNSATEVTQNFYCYNNTIYWKRWYFNDAAKDVWFDVSVVHIQTKHLEYYNNYVENIITSSPRIHARTMAELHFPDGFVSGNTHIGGEQAFLYVAWPTTWTTYDASYVGSVIFENNTTIKTGTVALTLNANTGSGINVKNLIIRNNTFGMYLRGVLYGNPTLGVWFHKDGSWPAEMYDIEITGNTFTLTWDTSKYANIAAVKTGYDGSGTSGDGLIYMRNAHTVRRVKIENNTVNNFPFSFLHLYRADNSSGTYVHENITVKGNKINDSCYAISYSNINRACFSFGAVNGIDIQNNEVKNPNVALKGQSQEWDYITNKTYSGNTFTT